MPAILVTDYSQTDREAWLRLSRTRRVGPITFYKLLERFGTPSEALAAVPKLSTRGGRDPLRPPGRDKALQEREAVHKLGGHMLFSCDARYPETLRQTPDPAPVLTVLGNADLLGSQQVAIVGSRNASANGLRMTTGLSTDLGQQGITITSGMARGIDAAAHKAALSSGTIAVVAGGVDVIYPAENEDLYFSIKESNGAIVSEMPLALKPIAQSFPRRNRVIAGLSLGTIVIEASLRSGSLITARFANDIGREVMAVPGSPLDSRAAGTNHLLREGATLITTADDVLEALRATLEFTASEDERQFEPPAVIQFDEDEIEEVCGQLLQLLSPVPTDIDELIKLTGAPPHVIQAALVELELSGLVDRVAAGVALLYE